MTIISARRLALLAAPALLALSSPALATSTTDQAGFDAAITEAKSMMMADSAAALESAVKAERLVTGETQEAQKARLTAQWLKGEALMRLNRADEAAQTIRTAITEINANFPGSKLHADLLRSEASLKVSRGDYGDALSCFLEAHELYEALGEDRSRAIVLQNIGSLYSDARDYERVLRYYKQAKNAFPEDKSLSLSAHNNTGNALKELSRYEEAEAEFQEALRVSMQMDSPLLEARILTNIASAQYLAGNLEVADQSIQHAMEIASNSAPEWLTFVYGVKGQIALERGDAATARMYLGRTFEGEDLGQTSPYFRDFHETAYQAYSKSGNYQLALQHLAAFNRIDGEAGKISSTANNALLAARFDAANRELRIEKLSLEKAANEAELNSTQQQVILLTIAITFVILAFLAALLSLRAVSRSRKQIKVANGKLTHVIQHDSLTELYSRDHFRSLLDDRITANRNSDESPILAFIDLDRFKQVNDVFGHAAGDQLLEQVAERFREAAREDSVVGRLGGDEFALLLPSGSTMDTATELSNLIIDKVSEPYAIDGFEILIGASIGLAQNKEGVNSSVHMTNADLALYAAKDRGRGICVIYEPAMRDKLEDRSSLEKDLESALENGQFSICYQPIVKSDGKEVMCFEALMRWKHPERGIVSPELFIPVAEESRQIDRLGAWMLREACSEASNWPDDIKLAVNVSTLQMNDPKFLNTVAQALAASGLKPERLVLELTESLVLEMDTQIEQLLQSLQSLGVTFALDDFGRGYSSLNYIDKMDFSMIKIDREFVQTAAAGSQRSQAVVSAIVALAQSLEIDVAAEGIEREEQAASMAELGCNCFQGFYFGRPKRKVDLSGDSHAITPEKAAA
ncbi:MAG: EAL domain-containing protein [Erythrobacter sp.]|uniref:EAL domain-containing protein n=1 Tax=Erythrobacter sp. TaxID=1042 RepID=UPI003298BDDE